MQAFSKAQFSALAFAAHAFVVSVLQKQTSRTVAAKLKKRAVAVKSKALAVKYEYSNRDKYGNINWKAFSDSQAAIIAKKLAAGHLQ